MGRRPRVGPSSDYPNLDDKWDLAWPMAPATQYSRARCFPSTVLDAGSLQRGFASSMLPKDLICRQGLKFHSGPGIKTEGVGASSALPPSRDLLSLPAICKWLRRHNFACQCSFYWEKLHNIGTRTLATKEPNHPTASQSSFLSPAEATMSQTYCLRHPA